MAGKSNTTATLFAQKKLLNKAHTSIKKSDAQETITTNIQPAAQTTFGQDIPAQPEKTLYLIQSASAGQPGTIEYVQFTVQSINGTSYDANSEDSGAGPEPSNNGPHGYQLILTGNYESLTSNPKAGNGVFDDGKTVSDTLGRLQIIPPVFSNDRPNPYSVTLYKGTPGANPATDPNIIPLESEIDYQLDTFNGILFVQDYDASTVPLYARAFIYIGDMMNEVIEDISVAGAGGDANAEYLVLSATGSLSNERVFSPSTGLSFTDSGANNNYTLEIDNSVVATLTGSQFSGDVGVTGSFGVQSSAIFNQGITGSLQKLPDGSNFLQAGPNVSIVNEADGSITISATGGSGGGGGSGDANAEYIVASATGSLPNAKLIEPGPGISIQTDSNSITISADSASITGRSKKRYLLTSSHPADTYFETSLTDFSEVLFNPDLIDIYVNGTLMHSGSVAQISSAEMDYNISTSGSINFAFELFKDDFVDTILSKLQDDSGGGAGTDIEYLVLSATGSLSNERVFTAGTGLSTTDDGPGANYTLEIDDSIVATLTGAVFTGPVEFQGAVTGSFPVDREKEIYFLTSPLSAGTSFPASSTNFEDARYEQDKIDVFVNGMLLHSGSPGQVTASERDYYIDSASSLKFSFDMKVDDVIDVVVFKVT